MSKLRRELSIPRGSLYLVCALFVLLILLYVNKKNMFVSQFFSAKQAGHPATFADTQGSMSGLGIEAKNMNTETNLSTLITDTPANVHTETQVAYDNEVLDIPHGMTADLFTDGKLTSCPDKMLLEFRVQLRSECYQPYTKKNCSSVSENISARFEGSSPAYELTAPDPILKKPNVFVPNGKGEFSVYMIVGSKYQYDPYGGTGCSGIQPSVTIQVFRNNVAVGAARLPDTREKYLGFVYERDLKKGLDKEVDLIIKTFTPYEIPVFLEEIPEQNTRVQKYLAMNPNHILVCNNGMVPCSVQGDYDGDKKQDLLFSVKSTNVSNIKFFAAMGSEEYVAFDPCDYGLWKTVKGKDKDVVFIDDVERSSCTLEWTGTTLWGPLGMGD